MALAEEAELHLTGRELPKWLNKLEDAHDNIRAAMRWAGEGGSPEAIETGLRIAGALWRFWHTRGYYNEGMEHLSALLFLANGVGTDSAHAGDALRFIKTLVKSLNGASALANDQSDYSVARSMGERALALAREVNDKPGMALALNLLGN